MKCAKWFRTQNNLSSMLVIWATPLDGGMLYSEALSNELELTCPVKLLVLNHAHMLPLAALLLTNMVELFFPHGLDGLPAYMLQVTPHAQDSTEQISCLETECWMRS